MARTCSICTHTDRDEIDRRLLYGTPLRILAQQFGTSPTSLHRHKTEGHIPQAMAKATEAKEIVLADSLLQQTQDLRRKALSLLDQAEGAGDLRAAGLFLRELRELIKLWAELEGRLASQPQISIQINPEWIQLRTLIINALEPYPDAREAVVRALP